MAKAPLMRIRNWDEYQHYPSGSRHIIWAKLYSKRLQDYDLMKLRPDARELSTCLICIALETQNSIPLDYKWLATRVQMNAAKVEYGMQELLRIGFVEPKTRKHSASNLLANGYQNASPKQKQKKSKKKSSSRGGLATDEPAVENTEKNGLPTIDPRHAERLLDVLKDKDAQTEQQVRSFVGRIAPAGFEKIREQVIEGVARHPAAFAHSELLRMVECGEYMNGKAA